MYFKIFQRRQTEKIPLRRVRGFHQRFPNIIIVHLPMFCKSPAVKEALVKSLSRNKVPHCLKRAVIALMYSRSMTLNRSSAGYRHPP